MLEEYEQERQVDTVEKVKSLNFRYNLIYTYTYNVKDFIFYYNKIYKT